MFIKDWGIDFFMEENEVKDNTHHDSHHEDNSHEKKEHSHNPNKSMKLVEKARENPWMIATIVLGVLFVGFLFGGIGFNGGVTGAVSANTAADNFQKFAQAKGIDVTVNDVTEQDGLYMISFSTTDGDSYVYVSKDGKNIVSGLVSLDLSSASASSSQSAEVPKTDKPTIDLYVMSYCPYGNQAEDTMLPVYNLLKDSVTWNVHFIVSTSGNTVSSLHGPAEVTEDEVEACILSDYGIDKWFSIATYVNDNCGSANDAACWTTEAQKIGIDVDKINNCVQNQGVDLMKQEEKASNAAGASGSPTLIINGVKTNAVYQYGNSDAYQQAICSGFTNAPEACNTSTGSTTTTAASGSC